MNYDDWWMQCPEVCYNYHHQGECQGLNQCEWCDVWGECMPLHDYSMHCPEDCHEINHPDECNDTHEQPGGINCYWCFDNNQCMFQDEYEHSCGWNTGECHVWNHPGECEQHPECQWCYDNQQCMHWNNYQDNCWG